MDNDKEKSIKDTILKRRDKITIIAIVYHINTLGNCDFKMKFENGVVTVVE